MESMKREGKRNEGSRRAVKEAEYGTNEKGRKVDEEKVSMEREKKGE